MKTMIDSLFLGFIKVHILHHASEGAVYGLWLIEELGRHGYRLSPGTLYPTLHALEAEGLLRSYEEVVEGKVRKYYVATEQGLKSLSEAREKVAELAREVLPATVPQIRNPKSEIRNH